MDMDAIKIGNGNKVALLVDDSPKDVPSGPDPLFICMGNMGDDIFVYADMVYTTCQGYKSLDALQMVKNPDDIKYIIYYRDRAGYVSGNLFVDGKMYYIDYDTWDIINP